MGRQKYHNYPDESITSCGQGNRLKLEINKLIGRENTKQVRDKQNKCQQGVEPGCTLGGNGEVPGFFDQQKPDQGQAKSHFGGVHWGLYRLEKG